MRYTKASRILLAAVLLAAAGMGRAKVTYMPASQVDAAFAKGMPLIEVENYKIHASRRDGPGMAEVHERDTDIVHVLGGSATLITGGVAVETKTVAPEEIRGSTIRNGDSRRLVKGDVVVIPNGVPHQFLDVEAPLTYYVVKVRSVEGGSK